MANLKNTTISDTGFFKLPAGDTAARPASPAARQLRFNTDTGELEQFRPGLGTWIAPSNTGVIATGGDAVYDVDVEGTTYRVHVFTSTGTSTFSVLQGGEVEYLIVAGGGGGSGGAGGAGAGGLLSGKINVSLQSYDIITGQGGTEAPDANSNGQNGEDSSALGLTAFGGGGGTNRNETAGIDGGSGSGSGQTGQPPGEGVSGQGNDGGQGITHSSNNWTVGGGGGGAGSPGQAGGARGTNEPGNGGIGVVSFVTGIATFYAGGGGGGSQGSSNGGAIGGLGGGADGGENGTRGPAGVATKNTGGGGGSSLEGGGSIGATAPGGSGIVVIRYPLRQNNPETAAGQDVRNGLVLDLDFAKPTVYSGSGSVVTDSRLNGIEGAINGASFVNPRTHRSAFEFDGSGDVINLGNLSLWNSFGNSITVECVFLFAPPNDAFGRIVSKFHTGGSTSQSSIQLTTSSGNIRWAVNGTSVSPFSPANLNQIYHVFGWYNGSESRLYVNGSLFSSTALSGNIATSDFPLSVGAGFGSSSSQHHTGNIYLTRIYNRALSDDELQQQFNVTRWRFGV